MQIILSKNKTYKNWLIDIKEQIRLAQIKSAVAVNKELLNAYWILGKEIFEKQEQTNWGDGLIEQLSIDLLREFPEVKGFSRTNLYYIKKWYLFYTKSVVVPQPVGQMKLKPSKDIIIPQPVGQLQKNKPNNTILPQVVAIIPWGHHREIISKCNTIEEATFYINETAKNNWSRSVLVAQIESKLYKRKGKSINNFEATLPKLQSDLAKETFKNPYTFDLLGLPTKLSERELETTLINNIKTFLLELGQGFAYMGKQFPIQVNGDAFFIDLLFYHTRLHCYVVVELKIEDFKPEFVGKLNFYLNAVDAEVKHKDDNPSIGLLLCKTPNKVVVEYTLKNVKAPLGVSEYKVQTDLPKKMQSQLPSISELKKQLKKQL
ncbi:MAG: PDDEXK nuclease domain-containing protein [Chitinophagaceae bacterium]|jgi:predicted nuclease of restriction endonuclease-like (RecB) superfamily